MGTTTHDIEWYRLIDQSNIVKQPDDFDRFGLIILDTSDSYITILAKEIFLAGRALNKIPDNMCVVCKPASSPLITDEAILAGKSLGDQIIYHYDNKFTPAITSDELSFDDGFSLIINGDEPGWLSNNINVLSIRNSMFKKQFIECLESVFDIGFSNNALSGAEDKLARIVDVISCGHIHYCNMFDIDKAVDCNINDAQKDFATSVAFDHIRFSGFTSIADNIEKMHNNWVDALCCWKLILSENLLNVSIQYDDIVLYNDEKFDSMLKQLINIRSIFNIDNAISAIFDNSLAITDIFSKEYDELLEEIERGAFTNIR